MQTNMANKSKIVLIQPPIRDFYLTAKRTIPYGLASIAASLANDHFQVSIVDGLATPKSKSISWPESFDYLKPFFGHKDISNFSLFHEFRHFGYSHEHIANLVRIKNPFLVGISSLFTAYADQALETARVIKKFLPQCRIVIGGHHPTLFPETVLKNPHIDFVIRGEGEIPFQQLANALKDNSDLYSVPGLCFKKKEIVHIARPHWHSDLSDLPNPYTGLINNKFYKRNKRGSISIVCSRGCPMQCSYCSVAASSEHGPYRQRPVNAIIKEIKNQLAVQDVGFIDFEDENLSLDKSWFFSLFSQLIPILKNKKIELRAMNGLYPPSLDEAVVQTMKKAGFETLNLALGSSDPVQLKRFKRNNVCRALENVFLMANKYDLKAVTYVIGAAPGQCPESSLQDLIYLSQFNTLIGFSIFYPAPGSRDYGYCRKHMLLPEHFELMRSTALPISDITTRKKAVTLLRLTRIINFMKTLIDNDISIPDPEKYRPNSLVDKNNRFEITLKVLQWFLDDGQIRGIKPNMQIFEHNTDQDLTGRFLEKLPDIQMAGSR